MNTPVKIMIAMPCYQGICHSLCTKQLLKLQMLLHSKDIAMEFFTLESESLVSRGRNVCATAFLKSDCSHLMFIDSDIIFSPVDVVKLVIYNKELITGLYPMKCVNFQKLKEKISTCSSIDEALRCTGKRVGNLKSLVNGSSLALMNNAPTGFMMIKKSLLENLKNHCTRLEYNNDIAGYEKYSIDGKFYNFFQVGIHNGRYLSEDYGFCELVKACNIDIFADLSINLIHVGNFYYY